MFKSNYNSGRENYWSVFIFMKITDLSFPEEMCQVLPL